MFNNAVKMRYSIDYVKVKEILFHKRFRHIDYITNGNDYWFLHKADLIDIALIILLDYFNGQYKNTTYNKEIKHRIIKNELKENNDKYKFLEDLIIFPDDDEKINLDNFKMKCGDDEDYPKTDNTNVMERYELCLEDSFEEKRIIQF